MLASLLWVSPAAQDFLKTTSQLLAGQVPSKPAALASALKGADTAACSGLLCDASIRSELAAKLEGGCVKEVSDKEAAALVDALGSVMKEKLDKIRAAANPMASKLANKGSMPGFKDVVALLPKGQAVGEALQKDWLLWHAVGHAHSPGLLPEPDSSVVHERLAIAACAGSGPVADCALALHMLENLDAYVAWESSLPGSKPPPKKPADLKGQSVLFPFDEATAKEVAVRRVLGSVLPAEAASTAALEVVGGSNVQAVVQKLAEAVRARAVIPLYSAPPAPKEPKDKKEGKGGKADAKEEKGKEKGKGDKAQPKEAAVASASGPQGVFGQLHTSTATQELQWHLLSYRLNSCTTLGAAAKAAPAKGAQAGTGVAAPKIEGIAGLWAPSSGELPPGHTEFSWRHGLKPDAAGFDTLWAPSGSDYLPPGHTAYSWEKVVSGLSAGTVPSVSASANAPAPQAPAAAAPAKPKAAAAKAKPAAAKPEAAAGAGEAAEGGAEAALCKLDIRCGRIKECGRVPDADTLYLLKVDIGEEQPRQVVSSLVKHYKEEELKDRQVVVYCNIKPGKMRNIESQAMLLAATKDKGADDEKCELLSPPPGVAEGTRAMCGELEAGSASATASVKHISKVWNQVQPLLQTSGKCEATFSGTVLTMKDGPITVGSLTGVGIY